jgi:fatty-acid desaturase
MSENIDYQELNERVEKALQRRKNLTKGIMFIMSIFIFVLFAVIAWLMAAGVLEGGSISNPDMDNLTGAMIMLTMGGLMSLVFNGIAHATGSRMFDKQLRSQVLMEEFGQMKRKRSEERLSEEEVVELSDDGEFIPVEERKKAAR